MGATAASFALVAVLWVQDEGWSRVLALAPDCDIKVEADDTLVFRGRLHAVDDQSLTLIAAGHEQTIARGRIRRIALNTGTSHRKRNVIIGLLGAAVVTSLSCAGKGPACTEASPLTFYPLAGAGVLIGAAIPSGEWKEVYRTGR